LGHGELNTTKRQALMGPGRQDTKCCNAQEHQLLYITLFWFIQKRRDKLICIFIVRTKTNSKEYKMMNVHPFKILTKDQTQVHCTACGELTKVEFCGNGPNNGLHLTGFVGYYNGFIDRFPDFANDLSSTEYLTPYDNAWFCHDCCVKLFEVFPHLAKSVGVKGKYSHESRHHPCEDETPCCKYAWKTVKDPHYPDEPVELYAYYNSAVNKLEWRSLEPF
jgi:hypothetical protein